jgi:hypothetical protein
MPKAKQATVLSKSASLLSFFSKEPAKSKVESDDEEFDDNLMDVDDANDTKASTVILSSDGNTSESSIVDDVPPPKALKKFGASGASKTRSVASLRQGAFAAPSLKDAPHVSSLPPISTIPGMFKDLVSRAPEIVEFAKNLKRPLRVATMCSGTESPLLALNLISRTLREDHGTPLEIEHVFSCEIEPFKQAYIERNFHPPILFRDVCELGNDYA